MAAPEVFANDFPYKFSGKILGTYPAYPGICCALMFAVGPPNQLSPAFEVFPYWISLLCSSCGGGFE
jgi:hypothetical protein